MGLGVNGGECRGGGLEDGWKESEGERNKSEYRAMPPRLTPPLRTPCGTRRSPWPLWLRQESSVLLQEPEPPLARGQHWLGCWGILHLDWIRTVILLTPLRDQPLTEEEGRPKTWGSDRVTVLLTSYKVYPNDFGGLQIKGKLTSVMVSKTDEHLVRCWTTDSIDFFVLQSRQLLSSVMWLSTTALLYTSWLLPNFATTGATATTTSTTIATTNTHLYEYEFYHHCCLLLVTA